MIIHNDNTKGKLFYHCSLNSNLRAVAYEYANMRITQPNKSSIVKTYITLYYKIEHSLSFLSYS